MTSFMIDAHKDRTHWQPASTQDECAFCRILSGKLPAHKIWETEHVVVILDILPLRRGHMLVIPKPHISRISDLPLEYAAEVGATIARISKAVSEALDNTSLNVVGNQGYAQAVPHVHFHVIPAPLFDGRDGKTAVAGHPVPHSTAPPSVTETEMHRREFEARSELDDDDAVTLVKIIRAKL